MKNTIYLLLPALLIYSALLNAQFKPGDVGFNSAEFEFYRTAKIKTATQLMIDSAAANTILPVSVSEFTEDGWLFRVTYLDNMEYDDTIMDEYTYFPDGRIRIISLIGYDMFPIQYDFEYDNKEKLIASSIIGAEARKYTYEYDKENNITKRSGKTNTFVYDDEGNLMDEMAWVDNEESFYSWNDKHQLITEIFNMHGEFYYKIDYEYNDEGTLKNYKVFYDMEQNAMPSYAVYFYYNENKELDKIIQTEEGSRTEFKFSFTYY